MHDHHIVFDAVASAARLPAVSPTRLELYAAVIELDPWRDTWQEERRPVVRRRRVDGDPTGGLAPREQEVAGGLPVGHDVAHGVADGERPASEPRDLDHEQLVVSGAGARVEARRRGHRLEHPGHDGGERDVCRGLDEPRAGVVEKDRAPAATPSVGAQPARPLAVLGERRGEAHLEDGVGWGRRAEEVYAGDVLVEAGLVEHRERDGVRRRERAGVGAVGGLDGL